MKKFALVLLSFLVISIISCSSGGTEGSSEPTGLLMSETASWNADSSDTFVVNEDVGTVKISGDLGGKTLYAANVNYSDDKLSNIYFKILGNVSVSKSVVDDSEAELAQTEENSIAEQDFHAQFYNWEPDDSLFPQNPARTLDNPVTEVEKPVEQLEYVVGETSKKLQIMSALDKEGNTVYATEKATLWSFNDICNVWVVDNDEFLTTDEKKSEVAEQFAEAFAKAYPVVRKVFGNEEDRILYERKLNAKGNYSWSLVPMNYLSDTGTKVNIVVYDIFGDKETCAVLGLFTNRDYYPNANDYLKIHGVNMNGDSYSNEGKYFYVDSWASVEKPNHIISTLVHEFQHMIHFAQKTLKNNTSDSNFNEMLSMLCEDMMQKFLNDNGCEVKDDDGPKGRLPAFMTAYYTGGIRGYDSASPAIYYANAYAFGGWLCRQYGGAELVSKMLGNNYANNECIVNAVNELNGTEFTFDDLMVQFIKACYGKDSKYTFNQDAKKTVSYSDGEITYDYPMPAINLWEKGSIYDLSIATVTYKGEKISCKEYLQTAAVAASTGKSLLDTEYDYAGPAIFNATMYSNLMPTYGMRLKRYEKFSSGTSATLTFKTVDGGTKNGMKVILYLK